MSRIFTLLLDMIQGSLDLSNKEIPTWDILFPSNCLQHDIGLSNSPNHPIKHNYKMAY